MHFVRHQEENTARQQSSFDQRPNKDMQCLWFTVLFYVQYFATVLLTIQLAHHCKKKIHTTDCGFSTRHFWIAKLRSLTPSHRRRWASLYYYYSNNLRESSHVCLSKLYSCYSMNSAPRDSRSSTSQLLNCQIYKKKSPTWGGEGQNEWVMSFRYTGKITWAYTQRIGKFTGVFMPHQCWIAFADFAGLCRSLDSRSFLPLSKHTIALMHFVRHQEENTARQPNSHIKQTDRIETIKWVTKHAVFS